MAYIGIIEGTDHKKYPVGSTLYGTCSTGAGTPGKIVTITNSSWTGNTSPFSQLAYGITIHVYMSNSNTASAPTLKVGETEAKPIMRIATTAPGTTPGTSWMAGSVVSFTYDGTYWRINDIASIEVDTIDGTSNAAISTSEKVPTERKVYYGLATINGSSQNRGIGIYAPTSAGNSGQYLKSTGSTPEWVTITPSSVGSVTPAAVATSAVIGTSTYAARADHKHNLTSATITSALGYTPVSSANPEIVISSTEPATSVAAVVWIQP